MKVKFEEIIPDQDSSFRILLSPGLNDLYYWHFHPEYELVYVEGASGTRHIGDHISLYEGSDLVFIGPNIPHLNFDYGVPVTCEQVVVQMKEDFLGKDLGRMPEFEKIHQLFEKGRSGLSFYGKTKERVGNLLKQLKSVSNFDQLLLLLQLFQDLATTNEVEELHTKPSLNNSLVKEQQRMQSLYRFIEENYKGKIAIADAAASVHLSLAAFCRYFKKVTGMTFTDFVNQYRINQSKKLLLQQESVTDACFNSGFDNLSYFNRVFRKMAGENPSAFRKKHSTL